MLNYDLHTSEEPFEKEEYDIHGNVILKNPFPGLRPFGVDESHLFFGRESQVDDVLVKLSANKFVTIMGYSGSGKSSLIYCGVIPVVYGGFMTNTGPNWNIITTRPGTSPIKNLSRSLILGHKQQDIIESADDRAAKRLVVSSILRSNANGLVETINKFKSDKSENTLIFIDQFEELFRYGETSQGSAEEARLYVNLILDACRSAESPVYVAITMRSDYVGECAKFPGLTQLINESNYLVPQMTRDQKRMAIEGPISVGGGRISKRLMKRLLNDIGDNQDQLPILQHALMRTWDFWIKNKEENEPIDIGHYNAIGKITEALSQHANETYDELSSREKEIAEILFKSLTEKAANNFGIRRPVRLGLVVELSEATLPEVIAVVDKFRETGRSFLMPPIGIELDENSIIEISHESLMRIWTRLKAWVDEEYESAQMYRRLSEAAAMYQIGRTGLWRPPDLQLALNWQKKQRPTRAWARRYDEAFERAIVFLDTSRITYEAEQKNQEMLQKRLLKRTKAVAVILGIAAIISILFFVYAITQSIEATKQFEEAEKQRQLAVEQKDEAEKQREEAEKQTAIAQNAVIEADKQRQIAETALAQARFEKARAEENLLIAEQQRGIASEERQVALTQRNIAQQATEEARTNYELANKLLYQSVAQSMAVKSLDIEDKDLKGLLAQQAKVFYDQYDGRKYDQYIYNGLYNAMADIKGSSYNTVSGLHRNSVRTLTISNDGARFYSTGTQGKVVSSSIESRDDHKVIVSNQFPNRVLDISKDDQWLALASDSSFVQVQNLFNNTTSKISGHRGFVNDVHFLPDNMSFVSSGSDRSLRINKINGMNSDLLMNTSSEIKSFDISKSGKLLVGGSLDGSLYLYDLENRSEKVLTKTKGSPIQSVAFSPNGKHIVFGEESGTIKIFDLISSTIIKELSGQKGRISTVSYSPDGKLLAAGSFDGSIYMWAVSEIDELPIKMTDNDAYVWDLAFTPDSKYIIAGCSDGDIRFWPTDPNIISELMCNELKRNLDEEEWKTYVGNDIPYRNTCINLLLNDY
ncbi:hypothetical protein [Fulvivirga sp.]|uniref:nSTAND1 domain-containing NTPase n=1 Tax=Fulvivirga sp. TaxID=1931237 RepID=UPI0032EB8710